MSLFAVTTFLSAFLLFQIQPIIGRFILPWFGGGASIWTVCLLFFQIFLLAGYAYSHVLSTYVSRKRQVHFHVILLLISFVFLPVIPDVNWQPITNQEPTGRIFFLLMMSIGLPFLLLASTTPLLQRWISIRDSRVSPYRLYALSNSGSLLALLTYPFLVDPNVDIHSQSLLWSLSYMVFVVGACWCGLTFYQNSPSQQLNQNRPNENGQASTGIINLDSPPSLRTRLLWLLLSGCGALFLAATTNQMTQDLAPTPFLWLLPLSMYLLSFIICFHHDRWYDRRFWTPLLVVSFIAALFVLFEGPSLDIQIQLMVCAITPVCQLYGLSR